jgi:hypothetical protein
LPIVRRNAVSGREIDDRAADTPPEEGFQRLQKPMTGMVIALRDQSDQVADVSLLDFVDALVTPVCDHVAPQQV